MDNVAGTDPMQAVTLRKRGYIAIITLSVPQKLNALTQPCYFRLASLLQEIAEDPAVTVTIVTGSGRFFSAGADVTSARPADPDPNTMRAEITKSFVAGNMHNTQAWYSHPKILITALNGPAVGISAANTAHADFVYAAPHAYLLTPFTSLGLVAEGGASRTFVERLGVGKANEALMMSRKIECDDLVKTGFVNAVFEDGGGDKKTGKGMDSERFLERVIKEVEDKLGPHLNHYSLLKVKELMRRPARDGLDKAGVDEVFGGLDVFLKGLPQKEFQRIASGEKKHKL
ncbi:MAG: hypothetical protein Q9162_007665 [Coniocarpon cinnabarinum]